MRFCVIYNGITAQKHFKNIIIQIVSVLSETHAFPGVREEAMLQIITLFRKDSASKERKHSVDSHYSYSLEIRKNETSISRGESRGWSERMLLGEVV